MMQNLKRNWLVISKLTWGIWWILIRALESLKNFHFNVLLLSKVYTAWVKKVQRSYLSWNWRQIQIWRGIDLSFQNWHEEFKQILIWALESLKNFHFNVLLLSKVYIAWANKCRGVIFQETEEGYKIWRGIDLLFQNWHEEFKRILIRALESLKKIYFNELLLSKVYIVWAKKSTEE